MRPASPRGTNEPNRRRLSPGGTAPCPRLARCCPTPGSTCARTPMRRHGDLPAFLDAVLTSGVDIIQLRDKGMEAAEELEHLALFADACKRHGKLLAVNDRADVAHAIGSDVLHLGQGDLPVRAARAIIGQDVVVGRSTHAASEVDAAVAEPGVDYFCTGPCWPTPTKPGRRRPGAGPRPLRRLAHARPSVVRHRRDRRGQPRRGAGRRSAPGRRRAGHHRGFRSGCRRRRAGGKDPGPRRLRDRAGRGATSGQECPKRGQRSGNQAKSPQFGWELAAPWLTCRYGPWHTLHQDRSRAHRA